MSTKQQQMKDVHNTIWKIADGLRGAVEGWDFKIYVLGTLFYKYLSEFLLEALNEEERQRAIEHEQEFTFDYRNLSDEESLAAKSGIVETYGFFLKPSQLFCNVVKVADKDENLNVTLGTIFKDIRKKVPYLSFSKYQFDNALIFPAYLKGYLLLNNPDKHFENTMVAWKATKVLPFFKVTNEGKLMLEGDESEEE